MLLNKYVFVVGSGDDFVLLMFKQVQRMHIQRFFLAAVNDADFVTVAFFAAHRANQAMKAGIKPSPLQPGMEFQPDFITRPEFLKVSGQGYFPAVTIMLGELMAGLSLRSTDAFRHILTSFRADL